MEEARDVFKNPDAGGEEILEVGASCKAHDFLVEVWHALWEENCDLHSTEGSSLQCDEQRLIGDQVRRHDMDGAMCCLDGGANHGVEYPPFFIRTTVHDLGQCCSAPDRHGEVAVFQEIL